MGTFKIESVPKVKVPQNVNRKGRTRKPSDFDAPLEASYVEWQADNEDGWKIARYATVTQRDEIMAEVVRAANFLKIGHEKFAQDGIVYFRGKARTERPRKVKADENGSTPTE